MLYTTPNDRMRQLVRTFSVPALKVETRTWLDQTERRRIKQGMKGGRTTVLFVKETGNVSLDVLDPLDEEKPLTILCLLTAASYPEMELQRRGLETDYVRETQDDLPLVLHHNGGLMNNYADLVADLRQADVLLFGDLVGHQDGIDDLLIALAEDLHPTGITLSDGVQVVGPHGPGWCHGPVDVGHDDRQARARGPHQMLVHQQQALAAGGGEGPGTGIAR